ncbi:MAG: hypothetical protein OEZ34_15415 [Spirochaetia bacterium]|nr:hypothetical protein [Spirochaetia bacterium]
MTETMKPAYQIAALIAFLLYFISFLTGRPGVEIDPYAQDSTFFTEERSDEEFKSDLSDENNLIEKKSAVSNWKTGLVKRVYLQHKSMNLFDDPLLVSDSRPDNFFKNIERTFTGDIFFLIINTVWVFMFVLAIAALLRRHWFYHPFLRILIYPSILFVMVLLVTTRRENIIFTNDQFTAFFEIIIESILLFAGLALIFQSYLAPKESRPIPFMEHLNYRKLMDPSRDWKVNLESLLQIVILFGVGILLSNLILLPIYKLQVAFPGLFALLLLSILFLLAFFYVTAYMKVSSSNSSAGSVFSGISFLGYRILRNTLFLLKILSIVLLVVITVILLANFNIGILETINILEKKEGF